jgi:alpha-glucosidase
MQWNDGPDAGFAPSGVKTWLPIPPSYEQINVTADEHEPDSMLHWYQQLIALKRQDPALHDGAETMLNTNDEHVLSWLRKAENGEAVVVACNFTDQPQTVSFDLAPQGVRGSSPKTLLKTPGAAEPTSLGSIQLGPFGVYIGRVE